MKSSSSDFQAESAAPIPAGGAPSPPRDPPAASGTPLRGQRETDSPSAPSAAVEKAADEPHDDIYAIAFEFGWQSRLEFGTGAAVKMTFETAEADLERRWTQKHAEQDRPWQAARAIARDAWNQVYDAITESQRTDHPAS